MGPLGHCIGMRTSLTTACMSLNLATRDSSGLGCALDRITCDMHELYMERVSTRGATHVEALLRPDLFQKEDPGYPGHGADVRHRLNVYKAFLEPHMAPNGLHHAERQSKVAVAYPDRGEHVVKSTVCRLQPAHKGLVALQPPYHVLAARHARVRPGQAAADHAVAAQVNALHVGAERRTTARGVVGEKIYIRITGRQHGRGSDGCVFRKYK